MNPQPLVLIVEDEPRMRELLSKAIGGWQCRTAAARTGEEALRMMEQEPADIVVLDLNLPAMSGMEAFEQMRRRWRETQVVILTGFGDLEAARQAIHLDVVEFLTKPAHLGELEQAIDRARRRLTQTLPEIDAGIEESADGEPRKLHDVEREHILSTLAKHDGNRAATAAELGISLRTLYYRLSEYQKEGRGIGDLPFVICD
jgi:DNA-binding NtrC family response regulator